MPTQSCRECQSLAVRWLEAVSDDAQVNYYRCNECGHVWTLPKDHLDAAPTAITRTKKDLDDTTPGPPAKTVDRSWK